MMYPFEDVATGEYVEIAYPIGKAPGIGKTAKRRGRVLRRLMSRPQVMVERDVRVVSHALPRWHPAAPDHDDYGRARFASRAEIREFCRADNRFVYDADCGDQTACERMKPNPRDCAPS